MMRQGAELANHRQVLEPRQVDVQVGFFGYVAESVFPGDRIASDRFAAKQDLTGRRFNQSGNDLERCRFPGAVRSEIARDLARARLKADIIYSQATGKLL